MAKRRHRSQAPILVEYTVAVLVVILLATLAGSWIVTRLAEKRAVAEVEELSETLAHAVVEPGLPTAVDEWNQATIARLDTVVRERVLTQGPIRVKIWQSDGTILYSDRSELIGQRFSLGDEEAAIIANGGVESELSDLGEPENYLENPADPLIEVYLPIRGPNGTTVLYENYFEAARVQAIKSDLIAEVLPVIVLGPILIGLACVPLLVRLLRRLRSHQAEKERLLASAIESSEIERRRIAADLHDGVVQDLTGMAFSLAGAAERIKSEALAGAGAGVVSVGAGRADARATAYEEVLDSAAKSRNAVTALRALLVEIYPPNLAEAGLASALEGLAASARSRGLSVQVQCPGELNLPLTVEALLFRCAQESIRNVIKHAKAESIWIEVQALRDSVTLQVRDDGVGISEAGRKAPRDGHFGLTVLQDLVAQSGGTLSLRRAEPHGTVVEMKLPTSAD